MGWAYQLKETFRNFYRQPHLKSATGFLKGLIAVAQQSKVKPMIKATKTLRNRSKGILRWFTSHLTHAVMEGLNSLLQAAKRNARGYRLRKTLCHHGLRDCREAKPRNSPLIIRHPRISAKMGFSTLTNRR